MIVGLLFGVLLMLCFVLGMLTIFLRSDELPALPKYPNVSVLVAARNEEDNILKCLQALNELDYPNYEVWIGNDHSTDKTAEMITSFINERPHFHLVQITENIGLAKGKSNVLAQLAKKATGDYFFITDADIQVPRTWISTLLSGFQKNVGIVSGFTTTEGKDFMSQMQRVDWTYAMGMVKVVSDWKPIVAVGNNMAVTREAYFATGGYENLPFSIVEDYQLFTEITKKGFGYRNLLHSDVLATSQPITNWMDLLQQRKRWMHGAFQLPIWVLGILILQASYYSLIVVLAFISPQIALNIAVLKWFLQSIFIRSVFRKLHQQVSIVQLAVFEGYQLLLSTASLLFYVVPVRITWKGRKY